jgi:hypothetical protein
LRGQAERIRFGGAGWNDDFSTLRREGLDGLFHGRSARSKPAFDRSQVNAAPGTDQLATLGEARQGLIHTGTAAEVQQPLCGKWRSFRKSLCMGQYLFGKALHDRSPVRNIRSFLTEFNPCC